LPLRLGAELRLRSEPKGQVSSSTREPWAAWKNRGGSLFARLAPERVAPKPTAGKDSVGSLPPSWTLGARKMRGLRTARADFTGGGLIKSARLPHSRHFPFRSAHAPALRSRCRSRPAQVRQKSAHFHFERGPARGGSRAAPYHLPAPALTGTYSGELPRSFPRSHFL